MAVKMDTTSVTIKGNNISLPNIISETQCFYHINLATSEIFYWYSTTEIFKLLASNIEIVTSFDTHSHTCIHISTITILNKREPNVQSYSTHTHKESGRKFPIFMWTTADLQVKRNLEMKTQYCGSVKNRLKCYAAMSWDSCHQQMQ